MADIRNVENILDKILIPRVPGTEGHEVVKNFIIERMTAVGWTVVTDKFTDVTPNLGLMEFENIIATVNPNAERYLTLACHYDSKYMPDVKFLGATDSACPCAMMISLAAVFEKYYNQLSTADLSLQYIFFDGEEAFLDWNDKDSIYGARHLAAKWSKEGALDKIVCSICITSEETLLP